jgi:hypothetical protein
MATPAAIMRYSPAFDIVAEAQGHRGRHERFSFLIQMSLCTICANCFSLIAAPEAKAVMRKRLC